MIDPSPAGFALHRVESRPEWSEVRALRDRALRRRGEIAEDAEGFPDDGHDTALNTVTFLLTRHGRAAGTTRSSVSSAARRWPLPCIEPFAHEIESTIGWDATILECSLTLVDPELTGDARDAFFHLFKAQMLRCALEDGDWLLAAVPETQIGFYRRMLNMEILSGCERYPRLCLPRVLMGLEYRRHAAALFKRIPTLAIDELDARAYQASGCIDFRAPPLRRSA
jgi:hypothetical protein